MSVGAGCLLLLLSLTLSAHALSSELQAGSVLSCSFPDSFLSFSVFRFDLNDESSNATQVSPETTGLSFNGQESAQHGLTYTTDANGSVAIRTTRTNITIAQGASLTDHARWCPIQKRLLFVSTREPNALDNEAWTAVFMATWDAEGQVLSDPVRLTPPNVADFSPAWGPHANSSTTGAQEALVAVASGSGRPGGSDIVVMTITENGTVTSRRTVAKNGGWPTFVSVSAHDGSPKLLFHRQTGADMDEWSIFLLDVATGNTSLLIRNGMTPSVSDAVTFDPIPVPILAFAFVDPLTGLRRIGLHNLSSGATMHVPSTGTHQYAPFYDARSAAVFFHQCRGDSFPNIRRRASDDAALDIAYVSGDFPSIAPDGQNISVIYANVDYFLSVDLFSIDGSNRRTIYNATHAWMTSWVGDHIAFTSGPAFSPSNDGNVQVSTIHVPTGTVTQLTNSSSFNQGYPSYSPDGTQIVFRTSAVFDDGSGSPSEPGPYHLQIIASSTRSSSSSSSTATQAAAYDLTPPILAGEAAIIGDTHPHWGPDGILFASDRGHPGRPTIWHIDPDGTNLVEVFDRNAASVHPAATPDGRIVFSSTIAGHSMEEIAWPYTFFPNAELFVMHRDGTQLARLTHDASNQANVFAGPQVLPPVLSTDGLPTSCRFRDSTNPEPVSAIMATVLPVEGEPVPAAGSGRAAHATVRKHGVVGKDASPVERRAGSGCLFKHHAATAAGGGSHPHRK